jgi:hypothetical protein
MQSEATLRQAVEEQLDLILKIEEERKVLKRENKLLKEEHAKMMNILKKYSVQKVEVAVETEDKEEKEEAKGNQM